MEALPLDFEIRTERLRLRIPRASDIPHVFEATRTSGFNDGMLWDPPPDQEALRQPLERAVRAWRTSGSYQFTLETDGEFAGRIALRPSDETDVLDIGYWTHPRWQGRGLMTEALRAVVALGFDRMGAQAVVACYATWNDASRRVLEKVGFRTVEIVPEGFVKGERRSDEAHVRLERATWDGACGDR